MVPIVVPIALLTPGFPEECLLSGFCWVERAATGPPSGLLFLAVGLLLLGLSGLRRPGGRKGGA